jgi:hypothetical protein
MWTAIGSAATAIAAVFAAISAFESSKASRRMEREMEATRRAGAYRLLEDFESNYREQYSEVMDNLGPWPDPGGDAIDPKVRRVVHDLLVSLCSVYRSRQSDLVEEDDIEYVATLFGEWLQNPIAKEVWTSAFRVQASWPPGFVDYVDEMLARPSPWDKAGNK